MQIYIGTSGWQYKHWINRFYPKELRQKDWLRFIAARFNTVEINNSFYNLPPKESFERWKGKVRGKKFVFSVKLYRLFTHYKRLNLDAQALRRLNDFISNYSVLGSKAGPLLVQLPPGMRQDLQILQKFLLQLRKIAKKHSRVLKIALELRHISWFNEQTYNFLRRNKIALVISDSPRWPMRILKTADFVYVRLHGSTKLYASDYTNAELFEWWQKIKELKAKAAYIYFDNDSHAYAVKNAKHMQNLSYS